MGNCTGLTVRSATRHADKDVDLTFEASDAQRTGSSLNERFGIKKHTGRTAVDGDLSGATL
jgi:hypothetical protein